MEESKQAQGAPAKSEASKDADSKQQKQKLFQIPSRYQ